MTLHSLRAVERYGATKHAEQYHGWKQLPPQPAANGNGRMTRSDALSILSRFSNVAAANIDANPEAAAAAFRAACLKTHPDHGGNVEDFKAVQRARDALQSA